MSKYKYIIQSRIRDYKHDIECCALTPENEDRIKQDQVIIDELEKILTGKGLGWLSYQSKGIELE